MPSEALQIPAADLGAYTKINSVIHSKARLAMVSVLAINGEATFTQLRDALKLTDGNIAAHLRALKAKNVIRLKKIGNPLKPTTVISLSPAGQTEFRRYLDGMAYLVKRHR